MHLYFKHIKWSLLLGVIYIVFTGCGKTDTAVSKDLPDCFDNIQNQGELGVDCGGPCVACLSQISALIDGVAWQSQGGATSSTSGNSIILLSGNSNSNLSLIYTGPFTVGTYTLSAANYTINTTQTNYIANTGVISFTEWNTIDNVVTGTFNFKAHEVTGVGDTITVTQGKFINVPFQP